MLDELLRRRASFVAFRRPGEAPVAYVQHDPALAPATDGERLFLLAPFTHQTGDPVGIRPDMELRIEEADPRLDAIAEAPSAPDRGLQEGHDRSSYAGAVAIAIARIRSGHLEKVVLARTIGTSIATKSPGELFLAACQADAQTLVVLTHTQRFGTWLGASPERLMSFEHGRIVVDALAGTLPADQAAGPDAWSAKERHEQGLVTHEVVQQLNALGITDLKTTGPAVKQAGAVAHLHTTITGQVSTAGPLAIARVLHPTPAVGGKPRAAAVELITSLEPRSRALYAGYWGPMQPGRADLFVNIRCMEIAGNRALLHVGAGITAGSAPERECDEVERKARTWLNLLSALGPRG